MEGSAFKPQHTVQTDDFSHDGVAGLEDARIDGDVDETLTDSFAGSTTRSQEGARGVIGGVVGRRLILCGLELRRSGRACRTTHGP